jgi:cytochrome c oxidase subunit 3
MAHEGAHAAHHETSPWGLPVGLVPLVLSLAAVAYFGWGWSLVGLILAGISLVLLVIGVRGLGPMSTSQRSQTKGLAFRV